MTYRIDIHPSEPCCLRFQGRFDADALAEVARRAAAGAEELLLLEGTEFDPGCLLPVLAQPRLRVTAESPYLARLLLEERR